MFNRRHYPLLAIGIVIPFILSNCSRFNSANHRYIRITNKTNRTLAFSAWETDATNRVNISQRFSVAKSTNPLIQPGQSVLISIKNINGHFGPQKTMKLFLYTVHDSMAYANNNLTISYKDLRRRNYNISINRDDLYYLNDAIFE